METHSLKFSKDRKKPCEAVLFTELHPASSSGLPCCQLVTLILDAYLDLVATSCYHCSVDKCISYLQLLCSSEILLHNWLREAEMFVWAVGPHSVAMETWKLRAGFAYPQNGNPMKIQYPCFLSRNLLEKLFVMAVRKWLAHHRCGGQCGCTLCQQHRNKSKQPDRCCKCITPC